jgi:ATPase family associated with various cellular activities (AAA)
MTADAHVHWIDANHATLTDEVAAVRAALERHADGQPAIPASNRPSSAGNSALDVVCQRFGLSAFERKLLVLCAAMELDGAFAALCARAHGDPSLAYPTFSLALATFEGAHWSALTPAAPLRRWGLLEFAAQPLLTLAPLRINESVLHELTGLSEMDAALHSYLTIVESNDALVPSHARSVERITSLWRGAPDDAPPPVVRLGGRDHGAKRAIAAAALASAGLAAFALDASSIPRDPVELDRLARACGREANLHGAGLYVEAEAHSDAPDRGVLQRFIERCAAHVVVATDQPVRVTGRRVCAVDVEKPSRAEQRALWSAATEAAGGAAHAATDRLTGQFDFTAADIHAAAALAEFEPDDDAERRVWAAACRTARSGLEDVAERLDAPAGWDDLVLPPAQTETLREIVAHARHRAVVYEDWAMAAASRRGLGISALFHGSSGTGKTLAAEVIGRALELDVYRVDLSQLVSKYIGETEKNLRRVFDAADNGGALLLFDECDALFGKRGEVQAAHDRYANVEVSYLLQRMEAYRGVAVLTTNMRNAIDPAFLRRLRFIVPFPFPDLEQRRRIWERSFSARVPLEGLDFAKLARLNVAGGSIRNIALSAAFLAANASEPVRMGHLLRAARAECMKIERVPTELEIGGWA